MLREAVDDQLLADNPMYGPFRILYFMGLTANHAPSQHL